MHESKEGVPEVGKMFCVWKMQEASGLVEPVEELCKEVETVRVSVIWGLG